MERFWLAEREGTQECSAAFLAEGQLPAGRAHGPEDIAVLAAMLVVPRIADWCAVYLAGESGSHSSRTCGTRTSGCSGR